LSKVLGHAEWAKDPRFLTNPDRVNNKAALYRMIEEVACTRTSGEWQQLLDEAGVPCAVAQTIDQVLSHEQTRALGILQRSPDDAISLIGLPLSFNGERPPFRLSPPALGAHTDEIFDEAMLSVKR
jgi:crotonobetainyl-CoA:carnitine CoA-transferase CaiB-like acyl-CoA transferase